MSGTSGLSHNKAIYRIRYTLADLDGRTTGEAPTVTGTGPVALLTD